DGAGKVAGEIHFGPICGGDVDANGVIDEGGDIYAFKDAGRFGEGLLDGNDLLNVIDVAGEGSDLLDDGGLFLLEDAGDGHEVAGEFAAAFVGGDVLGKIFFMLLDEIDGAGEVLDGGVAEFVREDAGGDVHAVEDVADVVEDAGGDLGHAGMAGH